MSTQAVPFQTATSLMGTLAAYEARRRSECSAIPSLRDDESAQQVAAMIDPPASAIYMRTLPSLHFLRWRPLYHLQAPSGWMNGPCAPGYDSITDLYHLFFQWNPKRNSSGAVSWGNINWGHATSTDMMNWTVSGTAVLKPGSWYDREGCFTGCMVPAGLDGRPGELTLFYTGVSRLPIHHTLPYRNTTETLAVAESFDNGKNFQKMRGNPVLPQPPEGMDITGWRDPYVAPWPQMDRALRRDNEQTLYGIISGGIRGRTPTVFLYAVNPEKLTQWIYLGNLVDLGMNHNISRWSGDMGVNWECGTFMTLTSPIDGSQRNFIIVGGEGSDTGSAHSTFTEHPQEHTKFPRAERSLQWMCGSIHGETDPDGSILPRMRYVSGGRFDHGALYGVNTFQDPKSGKHVAWGWVTEEDLPQRLVDRQNWSGMLSIPRELGLVCVNGVVGALRSKLKEITSLEILPDPDGTFTIRTLGISPAPSIETIRHNARYTEVPGAQKLSVEQSHYLDVRTCRFELAAAFTVSHSCYKIGMSIHHSEDRAPALSTRIALDVETETMMVERPNSSSVDPDIVDYTEKAPFTLFSIRKPSGVIEREELHMHAFFDESVLEVFINNRCTFAARVYPATKRCWGVSFWAQDANDECHLVSAKCWDGLRADIKVSN